MRPLGLLTDSECTDTVHDRDQVIADNDAYRDATDPARIAAALAWQTRDLDRLRARDSDELTSW